MRVTDKDLFEVQAGPSVREKNRAETKAAKERHRIFTNNNKAMGWFALSMNECVAALQNMGYAVSDQAKADPMELISAYVAILDHNGLVEDNHKTEHSAVMAIARRLEK